MTNEEKYLHRDQVARKNGYRPTPVPDSPEWAGALLQEQTDKQAATAAMKLRGVTPED